jgi:4a-hydroxytetrahydrobiopterin dehydratase
MRYELMPNANKTCGPCANGVPPLRPEEIKTRLVSLPHWVLAQEGKAIQRKVKLKNWSQAFALVARIDALAERENHHPDIAFGWGYCDILLTTHKIGGLHENDFIMAGQIEQLIGNA